LGTKEGSGKRGIHKKGSMEKEARNEVGRDERSGIKLNLMI
jgi:hypothetical protein